MIITKSFGLILVLLVGFHANADLTSCRDDSKNIGLDNQGLRSTKNDCKEFVLAGVEIEMLTCAKRSMDYSLDNDLLRTDSMVEDCRQVINQPWENEFFRCVGLSKEQGLHFDGFKYGSMADRCIDIASEGLVTPYIDCIKTEKDWTEEFGFGHEALSNECKSYAKDLLKNTEE